MLMGVVMGWSYYRAKEGKWEGREHWKSAGDGGSRDEREMR